MVTARQYEIAISLAESLVQAADHSSADLAVIYHYLCQCRQNCNNYEGARVAGELAARLALETGQWDCFGMACLDTSAACMMIGRHREALLLCYEYLARRLYYQSAARFELHVDFNLGLSLIALGEYHQAKQALLEALRIATLGGHLHHMHAVRHALVEVHIKSRQLEPVPRLLARCLHTIRHHFVGKKTWFYHMELRAWFALATGRPARATAVARRALERVTLPQFQASFCLILAQAALQAGQVDQARIYALAAQRYALSGRLPNLATEAADFLYEVISGQPALYA